MGLNHYQYHVEAYLRYVILFVSVYRNAGPYSIGAIVEGPAVSAMFVGEVAGLRGK